MQRMTSNASKKISAMVYAYIFQGVGLPAEITIEGPAVYKLTYKMQGSDCLQVLAQQQDSSMYFWLNLDIEGQSPWIDPPRLSTSVPEPTLLQRVIARWL